MRLNKPSKRILVLCEGITEYLYANALKAELPRNVQRAMSVEIYYDHQNDPKSLLDEALRRRKRADAEKNSFDDIWLFFDNDNCPNLKELFNRMEKNEIKYAYSSISIEHWFILHFEHCARAFVSGNEALNFLKTQWPSYHKTKQNHFGLLRDKLPRAIKHAKLIKKHSPLDLELHELNPFFTIDNFVSYFTQLAEDG